MFSIEIAAGLLIAGSVFILSTKGMNIHRSNSGWRSAAGAAMFALSFCIGGLVIMLGALHP